MLFFSIRCVSAIYNLIWDCDETYNYWEPLHFFLYGSGLQTWEYSPEFSLRSYLYTLVNAAPIWPLKLISPHQKIIHFYSLRLVFALISSLFEMKAYTALRRFSPSVAFYYLAFSLTNVGMFLSSTSFLPSTFAMHLITYAYAKWLVDDCKKAIFAIGCAVLLGWPFVAVFGLPIAVDYLFFKKRGFFNLISIVIVFGAFISIPIILVDSYLYGKFVFPPLNIFIYNVFSAKGGPELYGKEPFSYYVKNCILNFNVLYPIGLIAGLILIYDYFRSNNRYFFR
jgi:alpha-1,2-mannosyltransferase